VVVVTAGAFMRRAQRIRERDIQTAARSEGLVSTPIRYVR